MPRTYDSSRREEAARRTREAILDAAFKLHGMGVTDYDSLAAEANVSVATVRKHFPSREALYEHCTAWGMHYAAVPDVERLEATDDPHERLRLAVREVFAFYESLSGQIWGSYLHQVNSAVLTRVLGELDEYRGSIVDLALVPWQPAAGREEEARGLATGLLSFLTYRALRHDGGLLQEQAAEHISEALARGLTALCQPVDRGHASG